MNDETSPCLEPAWQEIVPLYALDALDEGERVAFEAHLTGCAACRHDLASYQEAAAAIGVDELATPPPELKADLLSAIRTTPQLPELPQRPGLSEPEELPAPVDLSARRVERASRSSNRARMLLAAAAAIVAIGGGIALFQSTGGSSEPTDRFAELASAPDAVVTDLDGADLSGGGAITVTWSPGRDEVAVEIVDLAPLADEQTYALWLLSEGDPVPAALFDSTGDGLAVVAELDDLNAQGWGISIEPAGGSPQPTTDVLFAGFN